MWIIERFEAQWAILEDMDSHRQTIPRDSLPRDAREGDVVFENAGSWQVDREATKKRQDDIEELADQLFID